MILNLYKDIDNIVLEDKLEEKTLVKLFNAEKLIECKEFKNYDKALDYVNKSCCLGFTCRIFRICDNKVWSKLIFYPPESL